MPAPRVFVSSTAYDLAILRGQLRSFIHGLGFDPVLSEHSDVLYDPNKDAELSCVEEVRNCDMLVVIIGTRFGSVAKPSTAENVDFEAILKASSDLSLVVEGPKGTYSITQVEVLKAVTEGIPIFVFVDAQVITERRTYQANHDNEVLSKMKFGSIEDPMTAKNIFDFIGFLRSRTHNNGFFAFNSFAEIENHLRKQWASLFQRMLTDQQVLTTQNLQIELLREEFGNLQTAILASIGTDLSKEVARGVIAHQYLIRTLIDLEVPGLGDLISSTVPWADVLDATGIESIVEVRWNTTGPPRPLLRFSNGDFKMSLTPFRRWRQLKDNWDQLIALPSQARMEVFDAIAEERIPTGRLFRPIPPEELHLVGVDISSMGEVVEQIEDW